MTVEERKNKLLLLVVLEKAEWLTEEELKKLRQQILQLRQELAKEGN